MWEIDFTDLPLFSDKDTVRWYAQHDFNFLYANDTAATYSLYDIGSFGKGAPRGVVFEQNKKTNKIRLVKYISSHNKFDGKGQGNFDYKKNGEYTMAYGIYFAHDTGNRSLDPNFEYGKNDSAYCIYRLPLGVRSTNVHRLENWPLPPRPVIESNKNNLKASGNMTGWTWYELSGPNNTTVKKVGKEDTIKPTSGHTYCVVGRYGIGYAASLPFTAK